MIAVVFNADVVISWYKRSVANFVTFLNFSTVHGYLGWSIDSDGKSSCSCIACIHNKVRLLSWKENTTWNQTLNVNSGSTILKKVHNQKKEKLRYSKKRKRIQKEMKERLNSIRLFHLTNAFVHIYKREKDNIEYVYIFIFIITRQNPWLIVERKFLGKDQEVFSTKWNRSEIMGIAGFKIPHLEEVL